MDLNELARKTRAETDGHHQDRAEGADLLEAAVIAVEKAIYWDRPETCHEGMYERGVQNATLRSNVALAAEMRALREEMIRFRAALPLACVPIVTGQEGDLGDNP